MFSCRVTFGEIKRSKNLDIDKCFRKIKFSLSAMKLFIRVVSMVAVVRRNCFFFFSIWEICQKTFEVNWQKRKNFKSYSCTLFLNCYIACRCCMWGRKSCSFLLLLLHPPPSRCFNITVIYQLHTFPFSF